MKKPTTKVPKKSVKKEPVAKTVCIDELSSSVATKLGLTKKAVKQVAVQFVDEIIEHLSKGENVYWVNFARLVIKETKEKQLMNPRTQKVIKIPPHKKVSIKPCKKLKESVDGL